MSGDPGIDVIALTVDNAAAEQQGTLYLLAMVFSMLALVIGRAARHRHREVGSTRIELLSSVILKPSSSKELFKISFHAMLSA